MQERILQDTVKTERIGNAVIVTPRERMDVFSAALMMQKFDALLDTGVTQFIVDLSAVRVVDSDGDYPLLHLLKRTDAVEGSVTLVCPPGNPVRVFYEMMHLDTLFQIVDSLDAALDELNI